MTRVSDATLSGFFGYRMKRAFNALQADLAQTLKPFDLRMPTYTVLVLVVDNPGLRQSQLADAMDIERPNLVILIDELENRGLILRDEAPNDRRAHALKPTPSGQRLCRKATAAVTATEARLLGGVERPDRDAAIDVMRRIERYRRDR